MRRRLAVLAMLATRDMTVKEMFDEFKILEPGIKSAQVTTSIHGVRHQIHICGWVLREKGAGQCFAIYRLGAGEDAEKPCTIIEKPTVQIVVQRDTLVAALFGRGS